MFAYADSNYQYPGFTQDRTLHYGTFPGWVKRTTTILSCAVAACGHAEHSIPSSPIPDRFRAMAKTSLSPGMQGAELGMRASSCALYIGPFERRFEAGFGSRVSQK